MKRGLCGNVQSYFALIVIFDHFDGFSNVNTQRPSLPAPAGDLLKDQAPSKARDLPGKPVDLNLPLIRHDKGFEAISGRLGLRYVCAQFSGARPFRWIDESLSCESGAGDRT